MVCFIRLPSNGGHEKGEFMTQEISQPSPEKRGIKWVFVGSQGLRAGWGMALFLAAFAGVAFALIMILHALNIHGGKPGADMLKPMDTLKDEALLAASAVLATLITAAIERRKLAHLALGLKNALPRFLQGLILGVVAMCVLIGGLWLCKAVVIGPIVLHGQDVWTYGGQWALVFLLVGIFEEFAFRGYLMQTLARGLNYRWATAIMGVLFVMVHAPSLGEGVIGLGLVFIAALVFSLSVWRTGTMWWAIGFHAAWDYTQSFVFGVADSGHLSAGTLMTAKPAGPDWLSGGATGPEGSILAAVIMIVVAAVIWFTQRKPDEDLNVRF